MLLRKLWPSVRRFVPVRIYPLLAVLYRWDARRTVRGMERRDRAYFRAHPEAVAPEARLRFKVVGPCRIEDFLRAGERAVDYLEAGLRAAGTSLEGKGSLLDWGCGCGRTALALRRRHPRLALTGADVDGEAIAWCRDHIPGAGFDASPALPPLPYGDGRFDVICAISVFTHIDRDRQDRWLAELRRVLRPGGVLLATVHGPAAWAGLPPAVVGRIRTEGIVFANTSADKGVHPDWYQTTWHTEGYIRGHWSRFLELAGYLPEGMVFELGGGTRIVHDLVALRRPSGDTAP